MSLFSDFSGLNSRLADKKIMQLHLA